MNDNKSNTTGCNAKPTEQANTATPQPTVTPTVTVPVAPLKNPDGSLKNPDGNEMKKCG